MFEANPHPMWVYATDSLAFLAVNDAAVRHYGYSRTDFLGMTIKDIQPSSELPKLMLALAANSLDEGKIELWRHVRKDGRGILVESSSQALVFNGLQAKVVLALDVTAKHNQPPSPKTELSVQKSNNAGQSRLNVWDDAALYQSYLTRFVENHGQAGNELLHLDTEAAKALAHKLKGVAGTLGLQSVADCCIEVETAIYS
jgi:PAS domain S-box-containing protein